MDSTIENMESGKLDPHEKVPQKLKDIFKYWKCRSGRIGLSRHAELEQLKRDLVKHHDISTDSLSEAFQELQVPLGLYPGLPLPPAECDENRHCPVYSSTKVPGMTMFIHQVLDLQES